MGAKDSDYADVVSCHEELALREELAPHHTDFFEAEIIPANRSLRRLNFAEVVLLGAAAEAATFARNARRGALVSYELPFFVSIIGMPPNVQTRRADSTVASGSSSSGGVSAFLRRVLRGASDGDGDTGARVRPYDQIRSDQIRSIRSGARVRPYDQIR